MTLTPNSGDNPKEIADESLITYPCLFPIKVMGINSPEYLGAMTHIARQFDASFDAAGITQRASSGGKYLGLTLPVTATSRAQLDELYRTLSTHPLVKYAL
jgi:uncharacterized protein